MRWLPVMALFLAATLAAAREWHSAEGKRSFQAAFVRVEGEKVLLQTGAAASAYPLSAFSAEDQQFAKNAQFIADAAAKWGAQSFEISQVVEGGYICRMALAPSSKTAPLLFTGEMFFLVAADAAPGKQGDRYKSQLLYGAGGRTYYPLKGEPSPIRAFALSAEEATKVWTETVALSNGDAAKQSPPVMEPEIEIITTRGMGISVGKGGLVAIDSALAKDATRLVVHRDGEDHPAAVVETDDSLGVAVVSCKLPFEPARIGLRKPIALGQSVFAVSVELNSTKRTLASRPTMTRGIVSRPADTKTGTFQHDATLPRDSLGGFILGEKGDVLGVFFNPLITSRALTAKKELSAPRVAEGLGSSISTQALSVFLDKVPGAGAPRTSSGGTDLEKITKELIGCAVFVIATREIKKPREITIAKSSTPAGGGAVTGWSLSKSGTRHNSKCRYYNAAMPCTATDGKPCKTCGG
jgi:S1-C subfamily serine protease